MARRRDAGRQSLRSTFGLAHGWQLAHGSSGQRIDASREFVGQGLSNIAGGFFSSYVSCGSLNRSLPNFEAGFAESIEQVFYEIGFPPDSEFFAGRSGKFRTLGVQSGEGFSRLLAIVELAIDGCQSEVRPLESGHVDLLCELECTAVLALAIGVETWDEPVPSRMVRIEAARFC